MSDLSKLSRRALLGSGAAAAVAGGVGLPKLAFAKGRDAIRAKNVIFCVADGMAVSVPTMADHLTQLQHGRHSYWAWLMKQDFAVNGLQDTRSLNSVVTDSSAASSAWGSGRRIWNGQLNMFPDGTELRPIVDIMNEAGVRTGLVTTTTITHATPAGFAVTSVNRGLEPAIAEKYLKSGVSVLMGGGDRFFSAETRPDKKDLYAEFAAEGFRVVKDRTSTLGLRAEKLLGIYSPGHLPFSVDRDNDETLRTSVPTLAEMSRVAIDNLRGAPNGFLLQIEGGRVDHGGHTDDVAALLFDQLAFEDAVKVAVDFALEDGETLVIITADHACGGPSLNGSGSEYNDSTPGLQSVLDMKCSYDTLRQEWGREPSAARVAEVVEHKLGVQLATEEAEAIAASAAGRHPFAGSIFHRAINSTLGMILGNHSKVTWTSLNHTSDHVLVTAVGPGSERLGGLTQNTTMFDLMLDAKGLKWNNPTMTYEQARAFRQKKAAMMEEVALDEYHTDLET